MESTDINMSYASNQKLPAIDLTARYGLSRHRRHAAAAGLVDPFRSSAASATRSTTTCSATTSETWSFAVNVSYPIGTSAAEAAARSGEAAAAAGTRRRSPNLEMQVTTAVREDGRAGRTPT